MFDFIQTEKTAVHSQPLKNCIAILGANYRTQLPGLIIFFIIFYGLRGVNLNGNLPGQITMDANTAPRAVHDSAIRLWYCGGVTHPDHPRNLRQCCRPL